MATQKFSRRPRARTDLKGTFDSKSARNRASEKAGDDAGQPNLATALGSFADARSVIETVCHSLENCDDYNEAASALRTGVRMFNDAYNQLDTAINRLSRSRPAARNRSVGAQTNNAKKRHR